MILLKMTSNVIFKENKKDDSGQNAGSPAVPLREIMRRDP
jgi:hypothetical protein